MNVHDVYQLKFRCFPSMALVPVNPTTKKIQNYQFKLNEVLGRGNFSTVYRGLNELTNESVAIKVVELSSITSPALLELLYSEIEILKTLSHPNIMKCHEVFTSANNCYIVTELCSDGNLETRIKNRGPLREREAHKTIYEMFQGLKYLAEQGIVHRDFKVENVLVNRGVAKIADFGFARRTRERFKDISVGSPIYMSPEGLLDNIYGPKTDVWAFGVFVFEIIHGDTPLAFCKTEPELKAHIMTPVRVESFHPSVPMDLREMVLGCLEISESKRLSIYEIEQTPFMQRIAQELGVVQERNARSNSRGKQQPQQQTQQQQQVAFSPTNYNKGALPPRAGSAQFHKLVSPDNRKVNSPRTGLTGQDSNRRNLSFQNLQNSNHPTLQRRGVSVQRGKIVHNRQNPHSLSQDARDKPPSTHQHLLPDKNYKIVGKRCIITFHECVSLLHYCRLCYKIIVQLVKLQWFLGSQIKEYFVNWLFEAFREVEAKVPSQIYFDGVKAAARQKKLQDVIVEYHKKYFGELTISYPLDTNLQGVQQWLASALKPLDAKINELQTDRQQLIIAAHYLMFLYETNLLLERSRQRSDYQGFAQNCSIEEFLTIRKESYDENTYKIVKAKIARLLPT